VCILIIYFLLNHNNNLTIIYNFIVQLYIILIIRFLKDVYTDSCVVVVMFGVELFNILHIICILLFLQVLLKYEKWLGDTSA